MERVTKVHEHYLRHLLLLCHATPVLLRAIVMKAVKVRKQSLERLLLDAKFTFKILYYQQYIKLYPETVANTDLKSWDTRLLCIVICLLFASVLSEKDCDAISCILEQVNDLDNYAASAALDYNTYETKWENLHEALLHLLTTTDSYSQHECTRLIQSFATEPIQVNTQLIDALKGHKDINKQVQMAVEYKVSRIFDNEDNVIREIKSDVGDENSVKTALPVSFTSTLQDMTVCENERIVLECELNTDINEVKWYIYSDRLTQTDNILIKHDSGHHSLQITAAGVQDTGIYSCLSGDTLTSAYVNVKELPVEFTELLTDTEILEGEDITLSCKVNKLRQTPVWSHDGKEIKTSSVRKNIASNGNEHKLTILNAKLYDEGKYLIAFGDKSSEATLTVKDNSNDLYKKQLTKQSFRNWIRGALGLLYLKQGLVEFSNKCMNKQHSIFITNMPASAVKCTHCSVDTLMPFSNHAKNRPCHKRNCLCTKKPKLPNKRALCPNGGFCSKIYDLIIADHRLADPCLANTDIPAWSSDPWSVGTCFVNTPGYKNKTSAHEIDCSGLLSIFINNVFFNTELGDVNINGKTDLFKRARDARNEILHNPNYELSESEFNAYISLFKAVLQVQNAANKTPLGSEPGTSEALQNLERLRNNQIDIDEEVSRTSTLLRDEDIMNKLEQAKQYTEEKIKKLEEILKEKEEQIKFLRQVRSYQPRKQKFKFQVVFDVKIVVSGSSKDKQYNEKIIEGMRTFLNSPHGPQSSEGTMLQQASIDTTVRTLVNYVVQLPGVHVSLGYDSTLKVCVSSNDALNRFTTLMNGSLLQQNVYKLRKWIEKDVGESVVVETSITSESLTTARKQLSTKGVLYDKNGDFKCNEHPSMQTEFYCVEHEEFCCTICKSNEHSSCKGVRKVKYEGEFGKDLLVVQKKNEYEVRKRRIFNRDKKYAVYLVYVFCLAARFFLLIVLTRD